MAKKPKKATTPKGSKFNANSKAKTKGYIINNSTNKKLTFQFNPTSVPYERSARFTSIESPGMSYPLTQYAGGDAREFTVTLFMYDKPYSGKIDKARKFLEALMPPEYNKKGYKKPPTLTFAYGYFIKKGVLTKLRVEDDRLNVNGKPIQTNFVLTIRQVGK